MSLKIAPYPGATVVAEIRFASGEAHLTPAEARHLMLALHECNLSHLLEIRYPLIDSTWSSFNQYPQGEEEWISSL